MQPVQEILNRIRWDRNLADSEFKIGYYDRIARQLTVVAFKTISFPKDDHFAFEIGDTEGTMHSIPYYRVKEIYQNGRLIWHRDY